MDTEVATSHEPRPKDEPQELVRLEANVEELPIFSASSRRVRSAFTWTRQGRDPATGKPVAQSVLFEPSQTFGHPGPLERDLYCQVIAPWIDDHGFKAGGIIGPIRYQDACTALGWKRSGQNYKKLHQAVHSLGLLRIVFTNSLIDGKTRRLHEMGMGLFERYGLKSEEVDGLTDRVRKGEFYLKASDWFIRNWEANYLKPYDIAIHRALRSSLARSLYAYLDKRAWRRTGYVEQVVESLDELRDRFRLGVRRRDNLLLEFRRAHQELCGRWPLLREARIEKITPGRYRVVYVFSPQVSLPLEPHTAAAMPQPAAVGEGSGALVQELRTRGMNAARAEQLARDHSPEHIRHHLDVHDQEMKHSRTGEITNPPGRLFKRIAENWEPFEGYKSPETQRRAAKARADALVKQKAENEAREREIAAWDAQTPEQKATQRLERYVALQSMGNARVIPEADRTKKYQEFLAEYRLQEESKVP